MASRKKGQRLVNETRDFFQQRVPGFIEEENVTDGRLHLAAEQEFDPQ